MSVRVTVDKREVALIHELNTIRADQAVSVSCKLDTDPDVEVLPVADVTISIGGMIYMMIERKTMTDFAASIIDHRFQEQRQRMIEAILPAEEEEQRGSICILYIVEGPLEKNDAIFSAMAGSLPVTTICGAIANLMCRDNIHVIRTSGVKETAVYIAKLAVATKKFCVGPNLCNGGRIVVNRIRSREMKQAQRQPEDIFAAQLMQIPRVGEAAAKTIAHEFKSAFGFITRYNEIGADNMKAAVRTMKLTEDGTGRKLGPAIAERIISVMTYV